MIQDRQLGGRMGPRGKHRRGRVAVQRLRIVIDHGLDGHEVGHPRGRQARQREHVRIRPLLLQRFTGAAPSGARISGPPDDDDIGYLGCVLIRRSPVGRQIPADP